MNSTDMISDSIGTTASIPMSASNPKDFPKKKRVNRSAKLKQCKLDVRREQWLSQVKNKETNDETDGNGGFISPMNVQKENRTVEGEEKSIHLYCELDSPSYSPTSLHSSSNLSGTNFTCSSSSSSGSFSGSLTGEDDDGCLDDWETIADALAATDIKQEQHGSFLEPLQEVENADHVNGIDIPKPEVVETVQQNPTNVRAWKHDDTYRPQSLPSLSKQLSLPIHSFRNHVHGGGSVWGSCGNVVSAPSSCPICCEDLDFTDSSFLPCSCGFRLCLFCHKRILEDDGRCPGCRKQYNHECVSGEDTRLAQTRSLIIRS
ncbi:uncharacterized protein LOC124913943 [Impatiens glandulifera]|uniref:uncharacterized protein LOC124913943 n=1 Tax=Impatiens glandulifera TaxID=253017 RepID=UPI001FB18E4E|nr:uncharacterized protein LOC124913943 [Impatiens glandulifera]